MVDRTKSNQESFNKGSGEPGMTGPTPTKKWNVLDGSAVKTVENQMAGPESRFEQYRPNPNKSIGAGESGPPNGNRRWK